MTKYVNLNTIIGSILLTIFLLFVGSTTFIILRLKETYRLQREIVILELQLQEQQKKSDSLNQVIFESITDLYKTLYEIEPQVKTVAVKAPPRVSLVVIERNINEIRERMKTYERYRLAHEARHDRESREK